MLGRGLRANVVLLLLQDARWKGGQRWLELCYQGPSGNRLRAEHLSSSMQVTVELKNDLAITGTLHSVDQYLNVKLNNVRVVNEHKYPHMVSFFTLDTDISISPPRSGTPGASATTQQPCVAAQMSVRNCFIRGSVVRYVQVRLVVTLRMLQDVKCKWLMISCAASSWQR